jgi:starvation-inducible DNA-binding protein
MATVDKVESNGGGRRRDRGSDPLLPHRTRTPLPESARHTMVELLQSRLADGIDLGMQIKQAHWTVKGLDFLQLHELFERLYGHVGDHNDEVAERLATLGGVPNGTLPAVSKQTSLSQYPTDIVGSIDHLKAMADTVGKYAARIRSAIDESEDAGDPVTMDLFTEIGRTIEKDLWLLEAHLQDKASA